MDIETIRVCENLLYFDCNSRVFYLDYPPVGVEVPFKSPPPELLLRFLKRTSYTFCLQVSDACNLCCDYCFRRARSGSIMPPDAAIKYLDRLFDFFPDGEKYFVDLSGNGEPLLNLKTVLAVADYCRRKNDELDVEVLPTLVTNGTLLSGKTASLLQKAGILFGVSLDGDRNVHDKHRKDTMGRGTFTQVRNAVESLTSHEYVGCAVTIGRDVFNITESLFDLANTFRTISYRPARGWYGLDSDSASGWCREYERLTETLIEETEHGAWSHLKVLLNGDDFYGRFISRVILNQKVANRCDGGITRFGVTLDGRITCCGASHASLKDDPLSSVPTTFLRQFNACSSCNYKFYCGGQCQIEMVSSSGFNSAQCRLNRRLVELSHFLGLTIQRDCPCVFNEIVDFLRGKALRYQKDPVLAEFRKHNPDLSFTQAKLLCDRENPKY